VDESVDTPGWPKHEFWRASISPKRPLMRVEMSELPRRGRPTHHAAVVNVEVVRSGNEVNRWFTGKVCR